VCVTPPCETCWWNFSSPSLCIDEGTLPLVDIICVLNRDFLKWRDNDRIPSSKLAAG
jgi:hypothetical protein